MNPPEPVEPVVVSPDVSSGTDEPLKPKRKFLRWLVIALAVLVTVILAVGIALDRADKAAKAKQKEAFQTAVRKCGEEPVVVVEFESKAIETYTTTTIYAPKHPDYAAKKHIHNDGGFSADRVVGYYCSLEQARSANPQAEDSTDNYTPEQKAAISRELLQNYAEQHVVTLYQIGSVPSKLKLHELDIRPEEPSNDSYPYEPYAFHYQLVSASEESYESVEFRCGDADGYVGAGWLDYTNGEPSGLRAEILDARKLKMSSGSQIIVSTYVKKPESGQAWQVSLVGEGRTKYTECGLYDKDNLLTKEEGSAMIDSLKELDVHNLPGINLFFF